MPLIHHRYVTLVWSHMNCSSQKWLEVMIISTAMLCTKAVCAHCIMSSIFSLLHIWVYIYEGNLSYGKRNGKTCMTIINLDGHQSFSCRMWLSSSSLPQLLKMVWRIIILVFYGCAKTSISGWEIVLTQSERLSFMK